MVPPPFPAKTYLITSTGRSTVLVMMLASAGSSTAGPTSTTSTSAAFFHIAQPLAKGRTPPGSPGALQQQSP